MKRKLERLAALIMVLAMCLGVAQSAAAEDIYGTGFSSADALYGDTGEMAAEMPGYEIPETYAAYDEAFAAAYVTVCGSEGGYAYVDGYYSFPQVQIEAGESVRIIMGAWHTENVLYCE